MKRRAARGRALEGRPLKRRATRPAGRRRKPPRAGKPAAPKASWTATTQGELAQFFDVALGTVGKWRESGMPGVQGRWDLSEITRWLRARDRKERDEGKREDPGERLKSYRADLVREKLLETRRITMRVADHERYTARLCGLFRASLLSLASSLGSQIEGSSSPAERDQLIRERCRELLEDLSGDGGAAAAPEAGSQESR